MFRILDAYDCLPERARAAAHCVSIGAAVAAGAAFAASPALREHAALPALALLALTLAVRFAHICRKEC